MCASGHSMSGCRSLPQVQEKVLSWCAHLKAPSSPFFHRLEHHHHSIIKELSSCNVPLPQRAIALLCKGTEIRLETRGWQDTRVGRAERRG